MLQPLPEHPATVLEAAGASRGMKRVFANTATAARLGGAGISAMADENANEILPTSNSLTDRMRVNSNDPCRAGSLSRHRISTLRSASSVPCQLAAKPISKRHIHMKGSLQRLWRPPADHGKDLARAMQTQASSKMGKVAGLTPKDDLLQKSHGIPAAISRL